MKEFRVDRSPIEKTHKTDEGYIKGSPVVTRTGVFLYDDGKGGIIRELRHPDDVFKADSLESLKGIPVTLNHPEDLVSVKNAQELQKGYTGDDVKRDGDNLRVNVTVTTDDATGAIESGKDQLSLGYYVDLVDESGIYNGERYDKRQTNIIYNHLAIVDVARAGAVANIKMDGVTVMECREDTNIEDEPEQENVKVKYKLDGQTHEVPDEIAKHLDSVEVENTKLKIANDSAEGTVKTLTKANETLEGANDALTKTNEQLKKDGSDAAVMKRADQLADIRKTAGEYIGDSADFTGKTVDEIKVMVCTHHDSGFVSVSQEKTDGYYSAVMQTAKSRKDADDIDDQKEIIDGKNKSGGKDTNLDSYTVAPHSADVDPRDNLDNGGE